MPVPIPSNQPKVDFTHQLDWARVQAWAKKLTGKVPDVDGVLFLIGVQELGQGLRPFSKEEKQDLIHIALCRVLSQSNHYILEGQDAEGWPIGHWLHHCPQ